MREPKKRGEGLADAVEFAMPFLPRSITSVAHDAVVYSLPAVQPTVMAKEVPPRLISETAAY
jgi:hypothetical protein